MSSLAAAQADGFYRHPEYDPAKHGGLSRFNGSKGANQFEQYGILRFELPFDGWCEGCGAHVGKGTRFNATKEEAGRYFSTKLWVFRMKCRLCSETFEVRTNPKDGDYDFGLGLRRKNEDVAETEESRGVEKMSSAAMGVMAAREESEQRARRIRDPLFRLEHAEEGKRKAAEKHGRLQELQGMRKARGEDDYAANAALRVTMRRRRREAQVLEEESEALGWQRVTLLAPAEEDGLGAARAMVRRRSQVHARRREVAKRRERQRLEEVLRGGLGGSLGSVDAGRGRSEKRLREMAATLPLCAAQEDGLYGGWSGSRRPGPPVRVSKRAKAAWGATLRTRTSTTEAIAELPAALAALASYSDSEDDEDDASVSDGEP